LLGELKDRAEIVVADLEAGVGTLVRLNEGEANIVLVVAEPTLKSIEVARRAAETAGSVAHVIVLANRVRSKDHETEIGNALAGYELVTVPEDPVVTRADREGRAPIDVDERAPAVEAVVALAARAVAAQAT
jgi:CO dehydrogenase nickel-insertion accessory protein CooC1